MRKFWARSLGILCLVGLIAAPARAEVQQDGGAWLMFAGQGSFKEVSPSVSRLRWWFDSQLRMSGEDDGLGQTVVRPGVGWQLTPETSVWLGYGWIRTFPTNAPDWNENRIWQQYIWTPRFGDLRFQSRTRLEERFGEDRKVVSWRVREFVKILYPVLPSEKLFFSAYEELFVTLNDTDWGPRAGVDQNRVFVGLNAPVGDSWQIEVGYMNRLVVRPGRENLIDHLASINVFLNLN